VLYAEGPLFFDVAGPEGGSPAGAELADVFDIQEKLFGPEWEAVEVAIEYAHSRWRMMSIDRIASTVGIE